MLRVVTFKLDEETLEYLDLYAKKYRVTRSDAIREAIWILLKRDLLEGGQQQAKQRAL